MTTKKGSVPGPVKAQAKPNKKPLTEAEKLKATIKKLRAEVRQLKAVKVAADAFVAYVTVPNKGRNYRSNRK